jgi:hypothetical protein
MGLSDELLNPDKKAMVVADCCTMIDDQATSKQGLSGLAVKTAYSAMKGIKPGFIAYAVEQLLPQCLTALDPIWSEGVQKGNPVGYLDASRERTADALLGVTDARVKNARSAIVRGSYKKLRGSAKSHVEDAVPHLARVIDKHTKV